MIFFLGKKIFTSNKSLHICTKKLSLDMPKNIRVNLIEIKYN